MRQPETLKFKVDAVMFDLDGTLVNTAPQIAEAANRMLAELDMPVLPYAQIKRYIGEGAQTLIKRCLTGSIERLPEEALFARAQPLFYRYYAENVTLSLPFDGVFEGLQALKERKLPMACVTNKPEKFTLPLLEATGLRPYFSLVIGGDTLEKKKPDPLPLHHVCGEFNVMEMQAMLVGDSATDIAAAQAAGCFIVTVPYGYNQGRPIDESKIDAMIDNLTELPMLLA